MTRLQQEALYSAEDDAVWEQYRQMNIRRYPAHLHRAKVTHAYITRPYIGHDIEN